jgi:hypothetical protein
MICYNREISEIKFPNFNPPRHEVAIKYSPINIKLCFSLILTLAIIQSLPFLHHYIYFLDHSHTFLLFLYLMTIRVKCKRKETGRSGQGGGQRVRWRLQQWDVREWSIPNCQNRTHCCTSVYTVMNVRFSLTARNCSIERISVSKRAWHRNYY